MCSHLRERRPRRLVSAAPGNPAGRHWTTANSPRCAERALTTGRPRADVTQPPSPSGSAPAPAVPKRAALDLADYDADAGTLRVIGNRDHERIAYVVKGDRAALDYWLTFRGDEPGPLLVPVSESGAITVHRITTEALVLRLRCRGKQAGSAGAPHPTSAGPS